MLIPTKSSSAIGRMEKVEEGNPGQFLTNN
jgi:hypothetical protein